MNLLNHKLLDDRNSVIFIFSLLRIWPSAWHDKCLLKAAREEMERKKKKERNTEREDREKVKERHNNSALNHIFHLHFLLFFSENHTLHNQPDNL